MKTTGVTSADIAALIDLSHEVAEMVAPRGSTPGDVASARGHAARAMNALLGTQVVCTSLTTGFHAGGVPRMQRPIEHGWLGGRERAVFYDYYAGDHEADPILDAFATLPGDAVVAHRRELLADRGWYGTEHVSEMRRAAGVDDCAYVLRRPGPRRREGVIFGFHRAWNDPRAFGPRKRTLMDAFARAIVPRCEPPPDPLAARVDTLSPRLRASLARLLAGDGERAAAARLGVTHATFHGYVKQLYAHFGVSSRAELMALWIASPDPR